MRNLLKIHRCTFVVIYVVLYYRMKLEWRLKRVVEEGESEESGKSFNSYLWLRKKKTLYIYEGTWVQSTHELCVFWHLNKYYLDTNINSSNHKTKYTRMRWSNISLNATLLNHLVDFFYENKWVHLIWHQRKLNLLPWVEEYKVLLFIVVLPAQRIILYDYTHMIFDLLGKNNYIYV